MIGSLGRAGGRSHPVIQSFSKPQLQATSHTQRVTGGCPMSLRCLRVLVEPAALRWLRRAGWLDYENHLQRRFRLPLLHTTSGSTKPAIYRRFRSYMIVNYTSWAYVLPSGPWLYNILRIGHPTTVFQVSKQRKTGGASWHTGKKLAVNPQSGYGPQASSRRWVRGGHGSL